MNLKHWGFGIGALLFASSAFGQQFLYGFLGGIPITNSVIKNTDGFTFRSAHKAIVGAAAEVRLPAGLSIEGDFLVHPFNLEVGENPPPHFTPQTLYNYTVFEIPVMLKARFTNGPLRPFAEGGISFRGHLNKFNIAPYGFTAGGGIEFGIRRVILIDPQLRYTFWGQDSLITVSGSHVPGEQRNQLSAILEFLF